MGPLILATGRNLDRQKNARKELLEMLLKDKVEAKKFCNTDHQPSPYEIADSIDKMIEEHSSCPMYVNEKYQVAVLECKIFDDNWPEMVWLSIRRQDRGHEIDWRDMQQIKNELVGAENEGIEMFPAESRLVDTANQRHLFVFKDPNVRLPFGFVERRVESTTLSTAKQRPLPEVVSDGARG